MEVRHVLESRAAGHLEDDGMPELEGMDYSESEVVYRTRRPFTHRDWRGVGVFSCQRI